MGELDRVSLSYNKCYKIDIQLLHQHVFSYKKAYQAHLQYGYKTLVIKSMFINNVQTLISGWKRRHVALDVKRTKGGKRRRRRRKRIGSRRRQEMMGLLQYMKNNHGTV